MKKMAVVGFGFMGVVHAGNILANDKLDLCGIVDTRENIFDGIADTGNQGELDLPVEQLRKIPVYKTLEECCRKEEPDAVSICVPLFLHHDLAKEALSLGLDVLLEKPFCPEVQQCQELIDLAESKNRILMVAHCIRFAPQYEFLAECIRDKRYGELRLLSTSRSAGEPAWGVWLDEKIKQTCGGALFDMLIHDIDFVHSCLGVPSEKKVNLRCGEYWELGFCYNNGGTEVSIKGGFFHRNTPFSCDCTATFDNATVRFSSAEPNTICVGAPDGLESVSVDGDMYGNELDYFADCIEARQKPEKCLPEDSLKAIAACRNIKSLVGMSL